MITQDRIKELLNYDEDTGTFTWISSNNRITPGDVAGSVSINGRRTIYIEGRSYAAQRVAWLYVHGVWPVENVRFLNSNISDISIANLYIKKKKGSSVSTSGYPGVTWDSRNEMWLAKIQHKGKRRYIGTFMDVDDAIAARILAEEELLNTGISFM